MSLSTSIRAVASAALLAVAGTAGAADVDFSGHLVLNTDIVGITFSLDADATNVWLGTTSWLDGANFDPSVALWSAAGSDWSLVDTNDDADPLAAGQGAFDAGFTLPTLSAGTYLLTVSAYTNDPAGTLLSNGYALSDGVPTPIATWNQPGYDINTNDQKGTFWDVQLDGVDHASVLFAATAVPEPSIALLMALGLGGCGLLQLRAARRR